MSADNRIFSIDLDLARPQWAVSWEWNKASGFNKPLLSEVCTILPDIEFKL